MKSYVITIMDIEASYNSAQKCIDSGKKFGVDIEMLRAITPKDNPLKTCENLNIPIDGFRERYSRFENCVSAFLSHYSAWLLCYVNDEEIQVFEHDAIVTNNLPGHIVYNGCISLGQPSYGKFKIPPMIGVNNLVSKQYFPGAHAYRLRPDRALELIKEACHSACPTDVYLHNGRFPWLQEYYPWPVEARDNFTTIQNENGCQAKHRYGPGYQFL